MRRRDCGAIAMLLLLHTAPLLGQGGQDTTSLARQVNRAAKVRVSVAGGSRELVRPTLAGDVLYFDAGAGGARDSISLARVATLQVRRSAWARGAVLGAVIGGAGGLVVGVSAGPGVDIVGFTMYSAAGNAVWGALIGAPFKRWVTVYRADDDRGRVRVTPLVGRGVGVSVTF